MTRISISDARSLARGYDEGDPLREALLALIDAAESLRRVHEDDCGCDAPGQFAICAWPAGDGALLARFDFDEEVELR